MPPTSAFRHTRQATACLRLLVPSAQTRHDCQLGNLVYKVFNMATSSTAAVRGFNAQRPPTTPPLVPTQSADRPIIPVASDPGYSIGRFIDPTSPSERNLRPPLFVATTPNASAEDAEKAGQLRMLGILADLGFSASN
ncbi:uncharacterized protein CTRU02_203040 [Colletotrichum truncatum]|uniref:Uncharacterized protein n=1 Tax=Colletotrichum truncatum TaxID=5467 RepID=A0ACC3Z851_COLTU|nr:uncharacterized protein CTRU02_13139 [Colletotrichum truncatum]KAF6783631.1 hypothetical protein CTRU02_13139 [Colletotrichum truncatum]